MQPFLLLRVFTTYICSSQKNVKKMKNKKKIIEWLSSDQAKYRSLKSCPSTCKINLGLYFHKPRCWYWCIPILQVQSLYLGYGINWRTCKYIECRSKDSIAVSLLFDSFPVYIEIASDDPFRLTNCQLIFLCIQTTYGLDIAQLKHILAYKANPCFAGGFYLNLLGYCHWTTLGLENLYVLGAIVLN